MTTPDQPDAQPTPQLDDQQAAALGHALVADLNAKVAAGARLFFAIYHHPRTTDLLTNEELMTKGCLDAYVAACAAFLPRRQR